MRNRVSDAVELFLSGCSCSQAVLTVYGEPLGLDKSSAMRIAAGFAGGMRLGETCGAVTGAFMVLGLRHSPENANTRDARAEVYARVADFARRFKKRNGTLVCRELLGCDISTPEGMRQAQEQNLFSTTCVKMVQDACEILEEMDDAADHSFPAR